MTAYPEELIEKVATALYESQNSNLESREAYFAAEAVTVLDALGFAPYGGPKYWRSAIHVEDSAHRKIVQPVQDPMPHC